MEYVHLGFDKQLRNDWSLHGIWVAPRLEVEIQQLIAAKCRLIWRKQSQHQTIRYGIAYQGSRFDALGALALAAGTFGLTCATFVLAVFRTEGIELIIEDTWEARPAEDRAWLEAAILPHVEDAQLAAKLRAEVDNLVCRIRPEEVFGAACVAPPAAAFLDAVQAGQDAVRVVDDCLLSA